MHNLRPKTLQHSRIQEALWFLKTGFRCRLRQLPWATWQNVHYQRSSTFLCHLGSSQKLCRHQNLEENYDHLWELKEVSFRDNRP